MDSSPGTSARFRRSCIFDRAQYFTRDATAGIRLIGHLEDGGFPWKVSVLAVPESVSIVKTMTVQRTSGVFVLSMTGQRDAAHQYHARMTINERILSLILKQSMVSINQLDAELRRLGQNYTGK